MTNMKAIETVTVGSSGAANIDFTNIPQTYTDLKIVLSLRFTSSVTDDWGRVIFNNSAGTSAYNSIFLRGNGTNAAAGNGLDNYFRATIANGNSTLASTFASNEIYIPNYTSTSINKIATSEGTYENNVTTNYMMLVANLWSSSSAINQITITPVTGLWAEHTTATLYGISNTIASGAKAYGGYITEDSNYFYHTFLSSGTFTPTQSLSCDVLVIAGGGSGGQIYAGGGGAGGIAQQTGRSLTATGYTVTIGAGGAGAPGGINANGNNGSNSVFDTITANGGGGGGYWNGGVGYNGLNGGSGGGGGMGPTANTTTPGGIATQGNSGGATGYGNNGGAGARGTGQAYFGGGGGGAGAVGQAATFTAPGNGGDGLNTWSSWATITGTGVNGYYAGGGGGATEGGAQSSGGLGGGGAGNVYASTYNPGNATANTGSGGGGSVNFVTSGSGGSGLVIIRYAK